MLFVVVSLLNLRTFGWKKEMFIITVINVILKNRGRSALEYSTVIVIWEHG